jgi:hypothetical protein
MEPEKNERRRNGVGLVAQQRRLTGDALRALLGAAVGERPRSDNGKPLGVIPFTDGAEIRVRWVTDQGGPPFLSLWLWVPDEHGELWPKKRRGLRIRWREAEPLAHAILRALEEVDAYRRAENGRRRALRERAAGHDLAPDGRTAPDGPAAVWHPESGCGGGNGAAVAPPSRP